MKRFQFSLAKMQRYKQQILDKEKNLLGALQGKQNQVALQIQQLEDFLKNASRELAEKQKHGMSAAALQGHCFLVSNTNSRLQELKEEWKRLDQQVQEQTKIVVKASQEAKSIDKLEEKQKEEYQLEVSRTENEERMELLMMQRNS